MAISKTNLARLEVLIAEGREAEFYSWNPWEKTRLKVLAMDKNECVRCRQRGRYSKAVLVHHVHHLTERPDLALSIYDEDGRRQLVSLCRACHEREHPERLRPPWEASDRPQLTEECWD